MKAVTCQNIFDGKQMLHDHALLLDDRGAIVDCMPAHTIPKACEVVHIQHEYIAPAFVDLQVNGAAGFWINRALDIAAFTSIGQALAAQGVTRYLPTVMSDSADAMYQALQAIQHAKAAQDALIALQEGAQMVGAHVEGPFFSPAKRGAHPLSFIRKPQATDEPWLNMLCELGGMFTLAPEVVDTALIQTMVAKGVRIALGHSSAQTQDILQAVEAGASLVTHLWNAMSAPSAREPGLVGWALNDRRLTASIIADGIHVATSMLNLSIRAKNQGGLFVVSDAMPCLGMTASKAFYLYNERIEIAADAKQLINSEGKLAGSALGLNDMLRYLVNEAGVALTDALAMLSNHPANAVGVKVGRLRPGYLTDFVVLDVALQVQQTWVNAHCVYNRSSHHTMCA